MSPLPRNFTLFRRAFPSRRLAACPGSWCPVCKNPFSNILSSAFPGRDGGKCSDKKYLSCSPSYLVSFCYGRGNFHFLQDLGKNATDRLILVTFPVSPFMGVAAFFFLADCVVNIKFILSTGVKQAGLQNSATVAISLVKVSWLFSRLRGGEIRSKLQVSITFKSLP